jgi:hypothetical protein
MKHSAEIHAARMRLRNSKARIAAIRQMPSETGEEAIKFTVALREYWEQLRADRLMVYGPDPQGYHHPARKPQKKR